MGEVSQGAEWRSRAVSPRSKAASSSDSADNQEEEAAQDLQVSGACHAISGSSSTRWSVLAAG